VGFGEHRVGLGGLFGWIFDFWVFLSFLGVILFLFGVFLTCFGVSIGFCWVFRGHRVGKVQIVGFGELQVGLGGL